ncbi:MAG: biotin--[acetyl-CoA-carboxylase] ligase [Rikenellaceae bacterium]
MIYHFKTLGSSNDEAQGEQYRHGDVIVAERQTAGRGQRGNKWLSGEGLNLTLSAVLATDQFEARDQFVVLQGVALAICDVLSEYGLTPQIKWTNDIYIGDKKIAGILLENRLSGGMLVRSVAGVGLNVNQRDFDESLPNPTSILIESGRQVERGRLLESLSAAIVSRFESLATEQGRERAIADYHSLLYRVGVFHTFRLSDSGQQRVGRICGVATQGELIVEWECGEKCSYLFKEIDFVIEARCR